MGAPPPPTCQVVLCSVCPMFILFGNVRTHERCAEGAHLLRARAMLLMCLSRARQGDWPGRSCQLPSGHGQGLRGRQLHGGLLRPGMLGWAALVAGRQVRGLLPQLLLLLLRLWLAGWLLQLTMQRTLQALLRRRQCRRLRQRLRLPALLRLLHGRRPGQLLWLPLLLLLLQHGHRAWPSALLRPVLQLLLCALCP